MLMVRSVPARGPTRPWDARQARLAQTVGSDRPRPEHFARKPVQGRRFRTSLGR